MTFRLPLLATLALPSILLAQRTPPDSARRIQGVVVTGAREPAVAGGASAITVRPDSIVATPAPSLEQLLRKTPFVLVRQNSRGEVELSVRGSDSRQAAVMLDGLPLTVGWDHRSDPSLLPLTGARQVTLVRGLASLLDGPNALGGVVSVDVAGGGGGDQTPRAAARLGTSVGLEGARVVAGSVTLPRSLGASALTLRVGGAHRERDGSPLGRNTRPGSAAASDPAEGADSGDVEDASRRTNSDLRQTDGFGALRYERADGAFAGLTVAGYRAERGVPPELHVEEPRLWRYPRLARALGVVSAGSGARETPLGLGMLGVSAGVNAGETAIEGFDSRRYEQVVSTESGDERTTTARVHGWHSLPFGALLRASHTSVGVRYDERLDDDPTSRYRQRLASTGAELEASPAPGLRLSGGVVRDRASTPETGGRPALGALARWGWRAGASARVASDALQVHASASRRSRFPALRELYSGSLQRFDPNPALRPETLTGLEAGATVVRGGLSAQGVVFRHRLEDAVVRITLPDRRFRRINRDEIRSVGVELLAGWSAPGGLSVSGDLLAQRVRVHDASADPGEVERHAEHQPRLRAGGEATVPLLAGLRGTVGARYTGSQHCLHPDLGRQVELGGSTVVEAGLAREWRFSNGAGALLRTLRAALAVENATDAAAYDQCGLPQAGRMLRVGVELF